MTSFLQQTIPYLRHVSDETVGQFLTALEEVVELGTRYVIRSGGTAAMAHQNDLLIGPRGMGVAGTSIFIPFNATLRMTGHIPPHFLMPAQPPAQYRRTAFSYVCGIDATFGMIARDDDVEPGRHSREALTDALSTIKRTAGVRGVSPLMCFRPTDGDARTTEGIIIGEDGFKSPMGEDVILWSDVTTFQIDDRIRLSCSGATVEISI